MAEKEIRLTGQDAVMVHRLGVIDNMTQVQAQPPVYTAEYADVTSGLLQIDARADTAVSATRRAELETVADYLFGLIISHNDATLQNHIVPYT